MDLSTLDATQPPDSQAVGLGAQRIRETRDAVLTSFNLEHDLTGPHTFPNGSTAAEPAPGFLGRLFINTDNQTLLYDTGSAWVRILSSGLNGVQFNFNSGSLALTPSYQTLAGVTTNVPDGGRVLVWGSFDTSGAICGATFKISYNGLTLDPGERTFSANFAASQFYAPGMMALHANPVAGAASVLLEAKLPAAISVTVHNMFIVAVVL